MNKKVILFLILLMISVSYFFNVEKIIQMRLSMLNQSIQSTYINTIISISSSVEKYINQIDYIDQLKSSNEQHLKYKLLYDVKSSEYNELSDSLNISQPLEHNLKKVKVLSYYKINDFSRVLLDKKDLDTNKIYALITFDGFSAGIVLNKNESSIAYLNQNAKCNYTVFIGKNSVPGITSGLYDGKLLIKYVPIWQDIEIGDEVITSSMDGIFPFGIKVGKVANIDIQDNIQEVSVEPYAKTLGNRDYYIYDHKNKIIPNN